MASYPHASYPLEHPTSLRQMRSHWVCGLPPRRLHRNLYTCAMAFLCSFLAVSKISWVCSSSTLCASWSPLELVESGQLGLCLRSSRTLEVLSSSEPVLLHAVSSPFWLMRCRTLITCWRYSLGFPLVKSSC